MKKSLLSQYKQSKLIELFVAVTIARTAASFVGVNSKTVIYYFRPLRETIFLHSVTVDQLDGEVEVDESYEKFLHLVF